MLVRAGIGERADALMRPLLGRLGDLTSRKGIESIWPILGSIERFEEILHRRVIGGIADKYDLEAAEQRLNVAGCPAIGEIGPAEVGARHHEFIVAGTSIVGIDPAMDRSEEHTSELQSLMRISYAVFCLKKNNTHTRNLRTTQQTPSNKKIQHDCTTTNTTAH